MALVPLHNENASLASLVRTVLSCVDRRQEKTLVQTETLVLLLKTLLGFLEPKTPEIAETAEKTVRQFIAQIETAAKNRDEDDYQARGGEAPKRKAWS